MVATHRPLAHLVLRPPYMALHLGTPVGGGLQQHKHPMAAHLLLKRVVFWGLSCARMPARVKLSAWASARR